MLVSDSTSTDGAANRANDDNNNKKQKSNNDRHDTSAAAVAAADTGGFVRVVLVRKENAKKVKAMLEETSFLDKRFRMVPSSSSFSCSSSATGRSSDGHHIAIPIIDVGVFGDDHSSYFDATTPAPVTDENKSTFSPPNSIKDLIDGMDYQWCPYSTKMLGSQRRLIIGTSSGRSIEQQDLSLIQLAILNMTVPTTTSSSSSSTSTATTNTFQQQLSDELVQQVMDLDPIICPRRLEIFGDDRTVVIPPGAFIGEVFMGMLRKTKMKTSLDDDKDENVDDNNDSNYETNRRDDIVLQDFWKRLAWAHQSTRIVRKGGIDRTSRIRASGSTLVWPYEGIPDMSGPTLAPQSWIRVTEQGIKQSFDVTRVMFSRGNISEKIRFGTTLVQRGDVILDAYAGIGYYTLPALVHGKASFVYACEWNDYAIEALRYNVVDNGVSDRVQILRGDCRQTVPSNGIINKVDRVSLGLLPSSEGGWRIAVQALKDTSGGWIHVHGNVPVKELDVWTLWMCSRFRTMVIEEGKPTHWVVVCSHVERVKSFAPTVAHYVADVYLGPPEGHPNGIDVIRTSPTIRAGKISSTGTFIPSRMECPIPSCALSPDGVLSQEWMR